MPFVVGVKEHVCRHADILYLNDAILGVKVPQLSLQFPIL
jgi:hypothetical protein